MKSSAALKAEIESSIGNRFAAPLTFRERPAPEYVSSGISDLDALSGGLPRGSITEILGSASSGRTSLLFSILAEATARDEICAVVDGNDAFDPASAAASGVHLQNLLWIRCMGNAEHALKCADMLIQGGGFGFVALDFGDVSPRVARRIPLTSWYRLQRAIENTPTVLIVIEQEASAKSCASLILDLNQDFIHWSGAPDCSRLLRGSNIQTSVRKPVRSAVARFDTRALG